MRPSSVTARTRTFANVRSTSQAQAPASPVVGTRPRRSRGTRAPSPFQPPFGRLPCLDRMSHLVRTRGGYPHRLVFLRGRSHPGCPPLAAGPAGLAAGRLRQTRAARPRRVMSPVGSERAVSSGRAGHRMDSQLCQKNHRALSHRASSSRSVPQYPTRVCLSDDARVATAHLHTRVDLKWLGVPPAHQQAARLGRGHSSPLLIRR